MIRIFIKIYVIFKKGIIKYIGAFLKKIIVIKLPKLIIKLNLQIISNNETI